MFKLVDREMNNCYGIFNTYEEAYQEKININHNIHMMCGGNYYLTLDIIEIK